VAHLGQVHVSQVAWEREAAIARSAGGPPPAPVPEAPSGLLGFEPNCPTVEPLECPVPQAAEEQGTLAWPSTPAEMAAALVLLRLAAGEQEFWTRAEVGSSARVNYSDDDGDPERTLGPGPRQQPDGAEPVDVVMSYLAMGARRLCKVKGRPSLDNVLNLGK
ncbi:unnamed protein product, partial [Prorocentrum cordatum]